MLILTISISVTIYRYDHNSIQHSPQAKCKAQQEGMIYVEPVAMSKALNSPYSVAEINQ